MSSPSSSIAPPPPGVHTRRCTMSVAGRRMKRTPLALGTRMCLFDAAAAAVGSAATRSFSFRNEASGGAAASKLSSMCSPS
eukprot:4026617-Prymnesium_polylepis.1